MQQLVIDRDSAKAKDDLGTLLEIMQSSDIYAVGACGIVSES